MTTFIPGGPTNKRRHAALQAALYHARARNTEAQNSTPVTDPTGTPYGSITFAANPASNSTITLGGTVITFGTTVAIGASLAVTLASLLTFLNASADANIKKCTYQVSATSLGIRSKTAGVSTFTLAASAATISHSPLMLPTINERPAL